MEDLNNRKHSLFTSTISGDVNGEPTILGENLTKMASSKSLAWITGSLWLGQPIKSKELEEAIDLSLRLLVDHGPYVSGAVNTMITARAGKGMVDSLIAGLLTIGPRFGGAVNGAAEIFYDSVSNAISPASVVENYAQRKMYIPGIGHRKYRIDNPDPRVSLLAKLVDKVSHPHLDFAKEVEKLTTAKKPNLILNVDGTLAAIILDLLVAKEKLSQEQIKTLLDAEFFNALFVASRTIGFIAHYLDQKRLGEPLFRLPDSEVLTVVE